MPKLWGRLGSQRNKSQGSKPAVVALQTMKSQSTKLRAIALRRIARRSFPQQGIKSESTAPESSKPPSIKSQSDEDGEIESDESVPERYWACCFCSEGGMSTFIECCSECKHYRCEDCPVELLKHRISDKSLSDAFAPLDEHACDLLHPEQLFLTRRSCDLSRSRSCIELSPKVHVKIDRPMRWWAIRDEISALSQSDKPTPPSKFFQTSLNSKSLPLRNHPTETVDSATSDKGRYGGHQEKFWRYQIYHAIDSCISNVFIPRRLSAAQTIPRVHEADSLRDSTDAIKSITPPSDAPDGNETSRSYSAESSNLSSSTGARGGSNPQTGKRGLNSDGHDGCEKSDLARRKRRLASNSTLSSPTFACHFHKKDSHKYCSFTDERYRNCVHPRIPSIRRIKDHFKNHRIAQCDRCFTIFDSKAELVSHRGEEQMCNKGDPSLKEGINDGEWEEIEQLVKARAHPGRQDYDKWYDIWTILFRDIPPPSNPWNEPEGMSLHSLRSAEDILADISASVADGVQRGALPPDERVHREYIAIIQRALGQSRYNLARAEAVMAVEDYFIRPISDPYMPEEEDINPEPPQLPIAPSNTPMDQNIALQSAESHDDVESTMRPHHRPIPPTTSAVEPFKRWSTGSYPSDNSMSTAQSSSQSAVVQTPIDPPIDPYPEVIEIPIMQDDLGWDDIRSVDILEDFLDYSFFNPSPKNQHQ